MKKTIYILFTIFIFNTSLQAQYDEMIDVSDALQSALDVRASAVKIVKDYLYRGLKVNYVSKENDENLANGEFNLLRLEIYAKAHPELKDKIKKVAKKWKKLRVLAIHKPQKDKIKNLLVKLKSFIGLSNKLIDAINTNNSIKTLEYQQAANNMELLSQQLAFLYGIKVAGVTDEDINQQIAQCKNDFQNDLNKTFFSGENPIEVSKALKNIQADWEMVKRSTKNSQNVTALNTIYVLIDKISNAARKSAILYQKKAKYQLNKNN